QRVGEDGVKAWLVDGGSVDVAVGRIGDHELVAAGGEQRGEGEAGKQGKGAGRHGISFNSQAAECERVPLGSTQPAAGNRAAGRMA
ncbi:hypothetical protein EBT25_17330, partial [bacterium]|nr:hypothetical protein [bacterium]